MLPKASISRFGGALWADGWGWLSLIGPFLSAAYWLCKYWGVNVTLQGYSYAWGLLPLVIWLGIAYWRRWRLSINLEEQNVRDRPDLRAEFNQILWCTESDSGEMNIFLNLAVWNIGTPSVADNYQVALIVKGQRFDLDLYTFPSHSIDLGKISLGKEDGLMDKTLVPIQTGAKVRGWLRAKQRVGELTRLNSETLMRLPGNVVEFSFIDIYGLRKTFAENLHGTPDAGPRYFPDGTGGTLR